MDREHVLRLQSAPGTAHAQHDPHQLQRDIEQHLRPVVEAGPAGREEPCQPETGCRRLDAEVRHRGNLRFTYDQVIDASVRGECGDCLKTGRLDIAVAADGVLRTGVVTMFVAVSGVVLGDAVHVGQHGFILPHRPDPP
ncbi:hypothetical protein [Streptomyces acidicola]|uniref:hypothetical protein n=1 Tax=Streptomyces acidicola TaxID=2596892 RepID=UPI003425AD97